MGAPLALVVPADAFTGPPPSYQEQVNASVLAGRAYLGTQQDAAGCWSSSGVTTGVTALAMLAVIHSEPNGYPALPAADKAVVDKATQCLLAHVQPNGPISDSPPLNPSEPFYTYETSVSIWALAGVTGAGVAAAIAGGRNWLVANQWNDGTGLRADMGGDPRNGGWWYSGGSTSSFVEHSNSSFALAGLHATGPIPAAVLDLAQGFFTCLQRLVPCGPAAGPMDGGFIYSTTPQKGGTETSATGSGSLALSLTGVQGLPNPDPRIAATLAYLDQSLTINPCNNLVHTANPLSQNWTANSTLIAYAEWANMKAHKIAGIPQNLADPNNYYFKLANCITNAQQGNGGFPPSGREDAILATAFSLLTLEGVTGTEDHGILKVCKVAGPGVAVGTPFTFTVGHQTVTVPAGAAPGGTCAVVPGTFPVGLNVPFHEAVPPGSGITVGSVSSSPPGQLVGTPDLANGNATVTVGNGVTEVTYTNKRTGFIEICKQSEGPALTGSFTFFVNPGALGPFLVPVGACSPPIEVAAGSVTVSESLVDGVSLVNCFTIPAGQQGTCNTAAQTSAITVAAGDPSNQTIAFFVNRAAGGPKMVDCVGCVAVRRPSNGVWYLHHGSDPSQAVAFGTGSDTAVPADFDGDGWDDVAVFRPATGVWYVHQSAGGDVAVAWGADGDIPVPADYDGDGKADVAVYRPSTGVWYLHQSSGGNAAVTWGTGADIPVPADYDGDGKADVAVYRPSTGVWYVHQSSGGNVTVAWGIAGDIPVRADYDGDGKADVAVYRPSTGVWYLHQSGGGNAAVAWGTSGDVPVPCDSDGDGKADIGVYRPSTGVWYLHQSTGGNAAVGWGAAGDVPVTLPSAVYRVFF